MTTQLQALILAVKALLARTSKDRAGVQTVYASDVTNLKAALDDVKEQDHG